MVTTSQNQKHLQSCWTFVILACLFFIGLAAESIQATDKYEPFPELKASGVLSESFFKSDHYKIDQQVRIMGARDAEDNIVLLVPVDYLTWNDKLAGALEAMNKASANSGSGKK